MNIKILRITEDSIGLISTAYRLCYNSKPKEDRMKEVEFIRACIKNNHTSPLEHCSVTLMISGISRACSHQIVRHRIASYTQESQRYIDKTGARYVVPEQIAADEGAAHLYRTVLGMCEAAYKMFQEKGIKREDARFILPQAIHTKVLMTINFRSLRNFLDLRLDPRAQWEVRAVAKELLRQMVHIDAEVGWIFGDITQKHRDHICGVEKED